MIPEQAGEARQARRLSSAAVAGLNATQRRVSSVARDQPRRTSAKTVLRRQGCVAEMSISSASEVSAVGGHSL